LDRQEWGMASGANILSQVLETWKKRMEFIGQRKKHTLDSPPNGLSANHAGGLADINHSEEPYQKETT